MSVDGDWGNWTLTTPSLVLRFRDGQQQYEVDLEDCATSAGLLDWIFQLRGKSWMTSQAMWDFLAAVDDVIGVQDSLCSFGVDHPIPDMQERVKTHYLEG